MLLRLLFPVVKEEKSVAAKRAFASSCAIVLKHATPLQAEKLIEETAMLHSGDRNDQISCAILLKSYSSMASDVMGGYHAAVVPIIFVSRSASEILIHLSTLTYCVLSHPERERERKKSSLTLFLYDILSPFYALVANYQVERNAVDITESFREPCRKKKKRCNEWLFIHLEVSG